LEKGDVFDSWINVWIAAWKTYGIGVDVSLEYAADLADYGGPGGWYGLLSTDDRLRCAHDEKRYRCPAY
jgi:hypothetical protein